MEDNSHFKQGLKGLCNRMNDDIIYAYEALKKTKFYWAFTHDMTFHGSEGERDDGCFKEFSMKDAKFTFNLRTTYYQSDSSTKYDAIEHFKKHGKSYKKVREVYDRMEFNFEEQKSQRKERLWIIKAGSFSSIDDFADYCTKKIDSNEVYVKDLLMLLSNMPTDAMKAYEKYQEVVAEKNEYKTALEREEDEENRKFLDELQGNINKFKSYVDYIKLYNMNPVFFLERLIKLPKEEKEVVIRRLLNDKNYKANIEINRIVSKLYPDLIAEVFRKGVKP